MRYPQSSDNNRPTVIAFLKQSSRFAQRIREPLGGTRGCVHLNELLLPIATTAFQTIPMGRAMVAPCDADDAQAYARAASGLTDTCHALRKDGPIVM